MLSVDEALEKIIDKAKPTNNIDIVTLEQCIGRILAKDQISSIDVPPNDNSAMDGYAIGTNTLSKKETTTLPISQIITAGAIAHPLEPNTAARIFTGAEIPTGANAVVMQEYCEVNDNQVSLPSQVDNMNNIRPRGQDIQQGDTILKKGKRLQAQDCALLASIGVDTIPVYRRLRIAILSTGNELIEPGNPLTPGKIYNSNRYFLKGLLIQLGWDILDCGVIADDLDATKKALESASAADCIISTGGVSVGEEDYIKRALDDIGELNLWRVAIKPGKPLAFGYVKKPLAFEQTKKPLAFGNVKSTPFFGLPGNPVSAFLTFLLFVKPFLSLQQGQNYQTPKHFTLKANFSTKANPNRQEYLRVTINGDGVDDFNNQSSGVLSSLVYADAFAIIPVNTAIKIGDMIKVIPFAHFFH